MDRATLLTGMLFFHEQLINGSVLGRDTFKQNSSDTRIRNLGLVSKSNR